MTSLMQSKRTKRQAARQNSAKMAISDARLAFTQERPLLCYKEKAPINRGFIVMWSERRDSNA